jgi:hypothetical protein
MYCKQRKQSGGSVFSLIVTLAIIGIGAYIGMQYIPQRIEAATVESMLENIRQDYLARRVGSMHELQRSVDNQLNINEMNDLKKHIKVTQEAGMYVVRSNYDRDLNLIFTTKQLHYENKVVLK